VSTSIVQVSGFYCQRPRTQLSQWQRVTASLVKSG